MSPGFQAGWLDDFHGAGEIDAGDHREAAHHRRLAGDGEAVLVVDGGIFDADGDVAVHQIGFVEIGERGLGAAIRLLDHDRLECRHAPSPVEPEGILGARPTSGRKRLRRPPGRAGHRASRRSAG